MTGLIPRPFIDDLLTRTDLVEFIDSYVSLKKRGQSYLACCPFHNEKTPSFNVVPKKQFYHCFGCGASGNAISFAMNYLNLEFVDAVETLATRLGLEVPREKGASDAPKASSNLYELLKQVSSFYQQSLKHSGQEAVDYLKHRGLSGHIAREYQLGYAPSGWHTLETIFKQNRKELIATGMLIQKEDGNTYDRYRHRIMFPIHDRHGKMIGFGGRAIDKDQKPKYLNSPETILFQKNRELYGLHQALQHHTTLPFIIVVEGYIDVIALAQYGIHQVVATLGTATSSYHIQLLSKHTKKIIFCFDGDKAGRQAAWRALESALPHLNAGLEAHFSFLPEGQDPDSLIRAEGQEGFLNHLKNATPLNQFFFASLMKEIDSTTLAGKSQLVNAAKPYLQKMNEGPYRQLIIDELAQLTRIDAHRIHQLVAENIEEKIPETVVNITRSPLRIAIALLVQNPELYNLCKDKLNGIVLDDPKQAILVRLLQFIAQNPHVQTASLIEHWRGTPLFEPLNKLAAWEHQVSEQALEKELVDNMMFLAKQSREKKIAILLEKSRNGGLTDRDRLELQDLLKQKHQNTHDENANLE
ncbi:DNA primase [Legionella impletisoli]|uniref:DNA primase n=1 Tax=Legionella impletisoli TaxID=343510 RepID=A0A917JX96_9GAMM|nr:DNA primase [Legionella impletisoli]GGI86498.1 DNA primase [Legionella impletisoli]